MDRVQTIPLSVIVVSVCIYVIVPAITIPVLLRQMRICQDNEVNIKTRAEVVQVSSRLATVTFTMPPFETQGFRNCTLSVNNAEAYTKGDYAWVYHSKACAGHCKIKPDRRVCNNMFPFCFLWFWLGVFSVIFRQGCFDCVISFLGSMKEPPAPVVTVPGEVDPLTIEQMGDKP